MNEWGWSLGPERNPNNSYGGPAPDTNIGQDLFGNGRYLTPIGVTNPEPPAPGAGTPRGDSRPPDDPGGPPAPPVPTTLGLLEGMYDRQNKKWSGRTKDGWHAEQGDLNWFLSNRDESLKKQKPDWFWQRYQDEQDQLWLNEQGQMAGNSGRRSMMGSPVYRRTAFGW